jgi:isoleucyl-tRNA synthetase
MLAPVLAFTADEAWEFVPGDKPESVHLAEWQPGKFSLAADEVALWKELLNVRDTVLPELEKARQAKTIGKALEAKLILKVSEETAARLAAHRETLRELLNVSQLEIAGGTTQQVEAVVSRADGQKCERCWHWQTDVGVHPDHPTICGRCVAAVTQS